MSSLAGVSLPPLVAFRSVKALNTRTGTATMPSRARRLGMRQGIAMRIDEHPRLRRRSSASNVFCSEPSGRETVVLTGRALESGVQCSDDCIPYVPPRSSYLAKYRYERDQ